MSDALRLASERIARFERLGGVNLARLDPEERDLVVPTIQSGTITLKKAIFWYRCLLCGNKASNDQEMEPLCTGPNWTDDHPPEVMQCIPSAG